jgi:hypothetical protein
MIKKMMTMMREWWRIIRIKMTNIYNEHLHSFFQAFYVCISRGLFLAFKLAFNVVILPLSHRHTDKHPHHTHTYTHNFPPHDDDKDEIYNEIPRICRDEVRS